MNLISYYIQQKFLMLCWTAGCAEMLRKSFIFNKGAFGSKNCSVRSHMFRTQGLSGKVIDLNRS
jgi:hypothetical protein